ncbi:PEP-CTERM sorting domain-containing protein [Anabaena subtropica]|uniref:PEP-CTERM sorting domain-containing protein n=1 Tax=Anabaena subtropica FACHB-260 TaxID=2692884 RepID=A0ABR8CMX3_9NOST|nr:PEP-CTERM sorting domain-containing protein [Anabaena subtropica]MBD2344496.1 PEP-CTERM sorting domain-containing protein [Anabaena subtropica FACHB-260]
MKRLSILPNVQFCILSLSCAAISLLSPQSATAATFELSFTPLEGIINKNLLNNAGTAIYRANLSGVGFDITAISVSDIIGLRGGAPGKFSGFDLDAIKISDRLIINAEDVKTIPGLNVFDFTAEGTIFLAGSKRDPGDSIFVDYAHYFVGDDLFGSKDGIVDNDIATLGSFDANAITNEEAKGFLSLGDGGEIIFKLTERVSTASPLYIYIGEVGNNGEQARGRVVAIGSATTVPEPTSLGALSLMGLYLTTRIKKKNKIT